MVTELKCCFLHICLHECFRLHREKLYEEKLRQQKEELKQLHEERQRLMEIQGKIQDLQWACPDLQVTVNFSCFYTCTLSHVLNTSILNVTHVSPFAFKSPLSSSLSQQGLLRKAPTPISTPAAVPVSPCSGTKSNASGLKPTPQEAATSSVTDNEVNTSKFTC